MGKIFCLFTSWDNKSCIVLTKGQCSSLNPFNFASVKDFVLFIFYMKLWKNNLLIVFLIYQYSFCSQGTQIIHYQWTKLLIFNGEIGQLMNLDNSWHHLVLSSHSQQRLYMFFANNIKKESHHLCYQNFFSAFEW